MVIIGVVGEVSRSRDYVHHPAPVADANPRVVASAQGSPPTPGTNLGQTDALQPRREKTDQMVHRLSGFLLLDQKFRGLVASFQVSHRFPVVALLPCQRARRKSRPRCIIIIH